MNIERLTTTGPALAALLQEAALLRGPFDGLLIGNFTVSTESVLHDTRDETTKQALEAHIGTFCCSTSLGSFYDIAGNIDAEEVTVIAEAFQGDIIGWFVHQHGPRRQPSVRERTVTAALAACIPSDRPLLFGLMNSALEADRSTVSFQQQFLEQDPGTVVLRPVELVIENIATSARPRDYRPLRPVAGLTPVSQQVQPSDSSTGVSSRDPAWKRAADKTLGQVAALSLSSQSQGLESVYKELLQQMEAAAEWVSKEQDDLQMLQYEVDSLVMAVGL